MGFDVYINGLWEEGEGAYFSNTCPSSGEIAWEGHTGTQTQVDRAMTSARSALVSWKSVSQSKRNEVLTTYSEALKARKEEIAIAISRDMGKPIWESRIEANAMAGKIAISIQALEERAGTRTATVAFGSTHLVHRPHGIMAVLGPFNFPGHLPNGHFVPALLAGNVCIFKPSEEAPGVAKIIADAFEVAGLPEGCFQILQGGRETGKALLEADINGVLFTGSAEAGLYFHRHFAGRPEVMLALEMGGNNPLIAWEPCDPISAANQIFQSAFITTGQRCSCARRLILPNSSFADHVMQELASLIATVKIGPWQDEDTFMGPLVSEKAAQKALAFQAALIEKGATPLVALKTGTHGAAFVTPGVLDITNVKNIADEELFGPLLQIIRVDTFEDAIIISNNTKFGLAGGLLCESTDKWDQAHREMKAGILNWNRPTTGAASTLPFGGPGHSGNFRPGAYYAADYCAWPQASQLSEYVNSLNMPGFN